MAMTTVIIPLTDGLTLPLAVPSGAEQPAVAPVRKRRGRHWGAPMRGRRVRRVRRFAATSWPEQFSASLTEWTHTVV